MAGMTLKQALESDEVRAFMNDCVEAAVSRELVKRGLGTGAGGVAARDARRVSARGRAVLEAEWPGVYGDDADGGVLDAGGDAA